MFGSLAYCSASLRLDDLVLRWARPFPLFAIVLALAALTGCSQSQDSKVLNLVAKGKLPQIRNPSANVIRKLVADPDNAKVSDVWLIQIDLADPEWAHLQELSQLNQIAGIHFASTKNTDEFVASLPAGDKITTLEFYETDLSDAGLAEVVKLKQLEELRLEFPGRQISTSDLSKLESLQALKKLHLSSDLSLNDSRFSTMLPECEVITEHVSAKLWE